MFTPHNMSHVTCGVSRVTCHMSHNTCHMSLVKYVFFFLFLSGEAYRWRVCYQRGLPRLVLVLLVNFWVFIKDKFLLRLDIFILAWHISARAWRLDHSWTSFWRSWTSCCHNVVSVCVWLKTSRELPWLRPSKFFTLNPSSRHSADTVFWEGSSL